LKRNGNLLENVTTQQNGLFFLDALTPILMNAIKFHFQFNAPLIYEELQTIAQSFKSINSTRIEKDHLLGMHLIAPTKILQSLIEVLIYNPS